MNENYIETNEITALVKLLGEKNEEKFRDRVTEILLERVESELDGMYEYLIDFEELFREVEETVTKNVKEKMIQRYTERVENKFNELFNAEMKADSNI